MKFSGILQIKTDIRLVKKEIESGCSRGQCSVKNIHKGHVYSKCYSGNCDKNFTVKIGRSGDS